MTIPKMISFVFAVSFLFLGSTGCRESAPNLDIKERSGDGTSTVITGQNNASDPGIRTTGSAGVTTQVVTAEPAIKEEGSSADTATTAEDKTGAVAVKTQY